MQGCGCTARISLRPLADVPMTTVTSLGADAEEGLWLGTALAAAAAARVAAVPAVAAVPGLLSLGGAAEQGLLPPLVAVPSHFAIAESSFLRTRRR